MKRKHVISLVRDVEGIGEGVSDEGRSGRIRKRCKTIKKISRVEE